MVSEQNAGGGESFRPRTFNFCPVGRAAQAAACKAADAGEPSTGFHFVFIVPINGMPDFFNSCTRLVVVTWTREPARKSGGRTWHYRVSHNRLSLAVPKAKSGSGCRISRICAAVPLRFGGIHEER